MEVYANALLKDNKIMFWWTGNKCRSEYDFYKDFYCSGLKMDDELATEKYKLISKKVAETDRNGFGDIEDKKAEEWYKQFEIHEDSKGRKPYREVIKDC